MIRIESVKHLGGERFEVTFTDNGTRQTRPFEYSVSPAAKELRPIPAIASDDAGFHRFLGLNRSFRQELFRKMRKEEFFS